MTCSELVSVDKGRLNMSSQNHIIHQISPLVLRRELESLLAADVAALAVCLFIHLLFSLVIYFLQKYQLNVTQMYFPSPQAPLLQLYSQVFQ